MIQHKRTFWNTTSFLLVIVMLVSMAILPITADVDSSIEPDTSKEVKTDNGLPIESTQATQAEKLGLSTTQPARFAPNGEEIDKNASPLGANQVVLNKIYQLALTYTGATGVINQTVYDKTVNTQAQPYFAKPLQGNTPKQATTWSPNYKKNIAVDIDGNGQQEVATLALVPSKDMKTYSLQLFISDYNKLVTVNKVTSPSVSSVLTIASSLNKPKTISNTAEVIRAVSGDFNHDGQEELAVAFHNTLWICDISMTAVSILSTRSNIVDIVDLASGDSNGDGFANLLVTSYSLLGAPYLYIFQNENVAAEDARIELKSGTNSFSKPTVDIGDLFGEGSDVIVIGGRASGGASIGYIRYNPAKDEYSTSPQGVYLVSAKDKIEFDGVLGPLDVNLVNFGTPVPGTPESVVLGGTIFKYDSSKDTFVQQSIGSFSNNSGLKPNTASVCQNNITNLNNDKDTGYIIDTFSGNFDGNSEGKEQLYLLHYNKWYDKEYIYVSLCKANTDGSLTTYATQLWKSSDPYSYPSVCPAYILDQGVKLEFLPGKSQFVFSNPSIMAVLGASPYYSELEDKYSALGNASTIYGTSTDQSNSTGNGFVVESGISFGYSQGFGILGVDILRIDFETKVETSMSVMWSNTKSLTKSYSYTNYSSDDAVVAMVIPYDFYYYKVTKKDPKTGELKVEEMRVEVPYEPITTMMPLAEYNEVAKTIKNAPIIGAEVLKHTVGNPRTYPLSSTGLSNVSGSDVLYAGSTEDTAFTSSGIGNSTIEQSITSANTKSKSFDYELSVEISFNMNVAGATLGTNLLAGYDRNVTVSSTQSTSRTGSVASIPTEYKQYQFNWALIAYNYQITTGDATQTFTVINYLVKPNGGFPPEVPKDFKVVNKGLGTINLSWREATAATGYRIFRATSEAGPYTEVKNLAGNKTVTYSDTGVSSNQSYYYQIGAYNAKEGMVSIPGHVTSLFVSGISVSTEPKLTYEDGQALDLSSLRILLTINDGSTVLAPYNDFSRLSISTSLANGVALSTANSGTPITVEYAPDNKSVNSANLTVNAKNPYDFGLEVSFKVGSNAAPKVLEAGKVLQASATLTNRSTSKQDVLLIMTLYNNKGTMEQAVYVTRNIAAGAKDVVTQQMTLPTDINGYSVKVFTWDGKSFTSTTLCPKSQVVNFPTL